MEQDRKDKDPEPGAVKEAPRAKVEVEMPRDAGETALAAVPDEAVWAETSPEPDRREYANARSVELPRNINGAYPATRSNARNADNLCGAVINCSTISIY